MHVMAVADAIRGGLWLLRIHSGWMGVNLALALVLLVLAAVLFRGRRRRGPQWWAGVATFVVFLPNAPYVMTDVVHLAQDARAAPTTRSIVLGLIPLYGAFMLVGVTSYVLCVGMLRRYLIRSGWRRATPVVEAGLHGLSAFGVLLGRVHRLNSWDLLHPYRLGGASLDLLRRPSLVLAMFVVVAGVTVVIQLGSRVARQVLRRPSSA